MLSLNLLSAELVPITPTPKPTFLPLPGTSPQAQDPHSLGGDPGDKNAYKILVTLF